jgi:hypothetical protein
MGTRECIFVFVLLSAVVAQGVNTTAPLNDKSWVPSEQTLIGHVGPSNENAAVLPGQTLDAQGSSDPGPLLTLYIYPELSSLQLVDPAASLGSSSPDGAGQSALGLIDGIGNTTDLAGEPHWSTDPKKYTDAGFVTDGSSENLPAFAEIDWTATPLPAAKKMSVMEIVVFPTLGVLVVVFIVGMLIVRLRRRRPVSQAQQLLRV